jgi:hypothetical protein
MNGLLIFPAFTGGGKGGVIYSPFKVWLYNEFLGYLSELYLKDIAGFAICIMISGNITNYENFKKKTKIHIVKGNNRLTVNLYIPIEAWIYKGTMEAKPFFSEKLKSSFHLLIEHAKHKKLVIDEERLRHDFDEVMNRFDARDFTKEAKFLDVDAKNPWGLVQ